MNNYDIVVDKATLDIKATLECGQLFRYNNLGSHYELRSLDKICTLHYRGNTTVIECNDSDYFYNYFDLARDYDTIKSSLASLPYMRESIAYGGGLRIVNQDPYEAIISFIISANNNIPRIKKIIDGICNHKEFPTLASLASMSVHDFSQVGAGYRARYLHATASLLHNNYDDFMSWTTLPTTTELLNRLRTLTGVGDKVADCIALFGYHRTDVFPVDTWIMQVYKAYFADITSPRIMRTELLATYGELSGYAQQYLFYYAREGEFKLK